MVGWTGTGRCANDNRGSPCIWVDADACPAVIKDILFRAAERTARPLTLVANQYLRARACPRIQVPRGFDEADKYIAAHLQAGDLVITADIPLAADVVARDAHALSPKGELYGKENIRELLDMRNFMDTLRSTGVDTGGPPPFSSDRQALRQPPRPAAAGGGARGGLRAVRLTRPYPRGRGNPTIRTLSVRAIGRIADARESACNRSRSLGIRAYPRGRGESTSASNRIAWRAYPADAENLGVAHARLAGVGRIADAGNRRRRGTPARRLGLSGRETSVESGSWLLKSGLSPRTRGNPRPGHGRIAPEGPVPADAEPHRA